MKACHTIGFTQLEDTAELTLRFVEHAGAIERDAEITMFGHAAFRRWLTSRGASSHPLRVAGSEQPEHRLAHFELPESGALDHRVEILRAVKEQQNALLRRTQRHFALRKPRSIELEDQIETRHLFRDLGPLVHTTRAFQQQRIGTDRDEGPVGRVVRFGLERERT